jgi:beta-N-acetylhexosaminidase
VTNKKEAIDTLGELLMIGFTGLDLPQETAHFISQARIGGVILYSSNYENPGQVAELTNQIQECRSHLPLWIGVDHEGGRAQRFKKGFTKIPEAAAIGTFNSPQLAFEIAEMMSQELKSVGVNLNFAPVADILTNAKNQTIASRSFGSNEEIVSKMNSANVRGHLVSGIQPCVKHFPGHGDTSIDSHATLPRVDTPLETLRKREFLPFSKAFRSKCSLVMTSHIVYSKLDPKYPATLSKAILQDILRKELRYTKLIISDDMEMKAITDHFDEKEAPLLALNAGCDLLIYKNEAAARRTHEVLVKAIENNTLSSETVLQAAQRARDLKKSVLLPYHPAVVSEVGKRVGTRENYSVVQKLLDDPKPKRG